MKEDSLASRYAAVAKAYFKVVKELKSLGKENEACPVEPVILALLRENGPLYPSELQGFLAVAGFPEVASRLTVLLLEERGVIVIGDDDLRISLVYPGRKPQ